MTRVSSLPLVRCQTFGRWLVAIPLVLVVGLAGSSGADGADVGGTPPVVLVHGICGSPASFGAMAELLEAHAGVTVAAPFDYSEGTARATYRIEELASELAAHIEQQRNGGQVDVVAHSMGGLIARAWMAGLTLPTSAVPSPPAYQGQIRRFIPVATPHYGAALAVLDELVQVLDGCTQGNRVQAEELRFGSSLVGGLHDAWEQADPIAADNTLFIAGLLNGACLPRTNDRACSDGVVEASSAILPSTPLAMVRYVPYEHLSIGSRWQGVVDIPSEVDGGLTHPTFRLVSEFISTGSVLSQDALGYTPPQFAGGLLLVRLRDATTGAPVATVDRSATIGAISGSTQQPNGEGASITAWGVVAPFQYDIVVSGVDGYLKSSYGGGTATVLMEPARPTVSPPISLSACPLQFVCNY